MVHDLAAYLEPNPNNCSSLLMDRPGNAGIMPELVGLPAQVLTNQLLVGRLVQNFISDQPKFQGW